MITKQIFRLLSFAAVAPALFAPVPPIVLHGAPSPLLVLISAAVGLSSSSLWCVGGLPFAPGCRC